MPRQPENKNLSPAKGTEFITTTDSLSIFWTRICLSLAKPYVTIILLH